MVRSRLSARKLRPAVIAGALCILSALLLAGPGRAASAATPPQVPPLYLGPQAYLNLGALSYLEIGDRVQSESAAEPDGSDHVVHERTLFHQYGPGILTSMRMQQGLAAPWTLTADGKSYTFGPGDLGQPSGFIPYPLSLNPSQSEGSSISYDSVPYQGQIELTATGRNANFDGIYRQLPYGYQFPASDAFNPGDAATHAVETLLNSAGTDIAPSGLQSASGSVTLGQTAGTPTALTTINGADQIRALTISVPYADSVALGNATLQITFDGQPAPAVNTPIKYLAGDGAGVYMPSGRQLVQGLLAGITSDGSTYTNFNFYYPMPFGTSAQIAIVPGSDSAGLGPVSWSAQYEPFTAPANWWGYFHANYTAYPNPPAGQDMTFLDYRGSGKLVGTVVNFGSIGPVLEGDPEIYLDNIKTPQIVYTGTEEWGLGGNYWNGDIQTSLPLGGLPSSASNPPGSDVEGAALYRFLIGDSIPFSSRIIVRWQHGGGDNSPTAESAAMMWYGTSRQTAVRTADLLVAKHSSAVSHGYSAPGQTLLPLTSAFEYQIGAPTVTGTVSQLKTSATFKMSLSPANDGAFLRRTFDSCVAGQKARIYVNGHYAGTWFDQGVSSADFGGTKRCWRDEDYPLPAKDTAGQKSITITITRDGPGATWTASEYQLYSFVN